MSQITRRDFVNKSAAMAAGASVLSAVGPAKANAATEKVVLALIGAGGRGRTLIQGMTSLENVETKYVCDVDSSRGGGAIGELEKIQGYAPKHVMDMHEVLDDRDVDAVVIATPEHWHALATVWACQAGKDVYVEKNISMTIWEGRKMIEAARKYKRIVQCGVQDLSAPYGFSAREYIKSGKLGKVVHVKVFDMLPGSGWAPQPDSPTPNGLDWDKWLGPAPMVPYNRGRHRGWYSWWAYSGGTFGGNGVHQVTLARRALDDPPHPKAVYCAGGRLAFPDRRETPDIQAITYDYGDFTMTCDGTAFPPYMKKSQGDVRYGDKFPDWRQNATRIEIYGTKRMMYLGRVGGGWQVLEGDGKVVDFEYGYFPDKYHQADFIECIRTRRRPNGDIEQGHHGACLVHLANMSLRLGRKQLTFDGNTETFVGNDDANKMLRPQYREGYEIPEQV